MEEGSADPGEVRHLESAARPWEHRCAVAPGFTVGHHPVLVDTVAVLVNFSKCSFLLILVLIEN